MTPAAPNPLTHRQWQVFEFLRRSVEERGFPPTVAEIAAHFGMRSPNAAAQHLRLMAKKGAIEITPGLSRGIRIPVADVARETVARETVARENVARADRDQGKRRRKSVKGPPARGASGSGLRGASGSGLRGVSGGAGVVLPIVGRVAAGSPILAEENRDGDLAIDVAAFRSRADYLLRVAGDSMVGAGIHDGDLVAVRRTPEAPDGAIAVVRVGGDAAGEVTVKRLRRRGATLRLLPENPRHRPIEVDLRTEEVAIEGVVVGLVRSDAEPPSVASRARSRR